MSETFDFMGFINGTSYPEDTVTLYTDGKRVARLAELTARLQGVEEDGTPIKSLTQEILTQTEAEIADLKAELPKTSLVFQLRGMPFAIASKIYDLGAEETKEEDVLELISKTIVGVTNGAGATSTVPTAEQLKALSETINPAEFRKLIDATIKLNYAALSYEEEIDAGFPSGSSDVE